MTHLPSLAVSFKPCIGPRIRPAVTPAPASPCAFITVTALLFAASSVLTIIDCLSMSSMPRMPMPGGWSMSMMWMMMPGQTFTAATASFLTMWIFMMMAMMMPSLAPLLWRYRQALPSGRHSRPGLQTLLAALGYHVVWALFGLAVFPCGIVLASAEMQSPPLARAVPLATSVIVLAAGAVQLTAWKARHLARCRETPACEHHPLPTPATAWKHGLRIGLHCGLSCANLTAILLAVGVMDLSAMALVTAAITAERLAPAPRRVAPAIGAAAIIAGLVMFARAAGLHPIPALRTQ